MTRAMDDATLMQALRDRAADLQARLLAKVEVNLSGDVLRTRSGTLKASIVAELVVGPDGFAATLESRGVAYAAIQEHGGTTPPHDIVPVKARALAFAGAGGAVFARRVHHPGSSIPARAYLGGALEALRGEITGGLKQAVHDALGAA